MKLHRFYPATFIVQLSSMPYGTFASHLSKSSCKSTSDFRKKLSDVS